MSKEPIENVTHWRAGWRDFRINDGHWRWFSYALILVVGLIMLATFLHYGASWDEEVQSKLGDNVLAWYASLFKDRRALDATVLYGGFFEVIAQLAAGGLPFGLYESRHLVTCAAGLLAIAFTYQLGAYVANPMAGFFSALFLTLTPSFYGHSFINSKDIPFLTLTLIALYYIVVSYKRLPQPPKSLIVKLGISIGLAMGIRVGGIILLGYLGMFWLAWLIVAARMKSPEREVSWRRVVQRLSLSFAAILLMAWVMMLIWWPWAQIKPLNNPFRALTQFTHFGAEFKTLFAGNMVYSTELPWHYLLTWFSISLPEFYFMSLLAGGLLACLYILGRRQAAASVPVEQLIKLGLLAFAFCFPIAMVIVLHSTLYDAMRHFLFTIPPLAILAGISCAALFHSRAHRLIKLTFALLVLISTGATVIDMVQLHPYQYIYFNRTIAGGLKAASQRYETEYWGCSYKEGTEWLINNYRPDAQERISVANCSTDFLTAYYLEKSEALKQRFAPIAPNDDPNVLLTITRSPCFKKRKGQLLHVVERQGVPLLYIIETRNPQ